MEDEMVGWHHRLNGHEFEQTLGVGDGQGGLACCSPWGHRELDMTEQLNREGNGTPLQYSCLENPMDRGAWKAAVHGVTEGWTQLSDFTFTFHLHALEKEMATHSSVLAWRIPGTGEPGDPPVCGVAQSRTRLKRLSSSSSSYVMAPNRLILEFMCLHAKLFQSCLTLCDPIDGSPPGSPVPGIIQARTLEWGAISLSSA